MLPVHTAAGIGPVSAARDRAGSSTRTGGSAGGDDRGVCGGGGGGGKGDSGGEIGCGLGSGTGGGGGVGGGAVHAMSTSRMSACMTWSRLWPCWSTMTVLQSP